MRYPNLPTYDLLDTRYWWCNCKKVGRIIDPEARNIPFSYEQLIKIAVSGTIEEIGRRRNAR